jgi:RHS repeat-associated protein
VEDLRYDARARVTMARYGNGAVCAHAYDPQTFRLIRTRATRRRGRLQDLSYLYDPSGNLTRVQDRAQQDIFFAGQVVSPTADYTYDATYRLIEASGREHRAPDGPRRGGPEQAGLPGEILPADGQAMRGYRETYRYNGAGNLERLAHHASQGDWTRVYHYDEPGSPGGSNRVTSTATGPDEARYRYDENGNMVAMPHLAVLAWDWTDQLHATARRAGHRAGPVTYYQYDGTGARLRKVTDGERGTRRRERIYLGGYEIYREYSGTGEVTLERQDLHVASGSQVICHIETTTAHRRLAPGTAARQYRYQLDNHLGSSCVELDEHGSVLTYEEYYPWGGSSWRAGRSRAETALKRYRFSGQERDDETGLYYFGSRYYAPWLGRWTAPDPSGMTDGTDGYAYARDNPVGLVDPVGADATAPPTDEDMDAGAPAPKQPDEGSTDGASTDGGGTDGDAGALKPPPDPSYVNEAGEAVFLMPADEAQKQHAELQEGGAAPPDEAQKGNVPATDNKAVREYVHQEVVIGAKAAARNDPIIATAVVLTGIVTYQFDKKKGQAIVSSIDGPEPESEIAQASQTYTAAAIAVVETLVDAAAGGLSELSAARGAAPKGNPFGFTGELSEMGETLQGQVSTVQETLKPFEGIRHGDISVPPNKTMIAGATTVVGGQQRTVVTFSNEGAHNVFARGYAELPSGVELGPPPRFGAGGRLVKQSHVERGAVNRLQARYGARGGLVTTSGKACVNCAQVWHNGRAFPTWIHLKQY